MEQEKEMSEERNGKTGLHLALADRFGDHRVSSVPILEGCFPLLLIDLELSSPVTVLMTDGLSDYRMEVPDKLKGREYNELYFCLPSYWDWQDPENPNVNWVFHWIRKLASYAVEKGAWFGPGHTIPSGKNLEPFSPVQQQNHLILTDPILLKDHLAPITLGDKTIYFLAVIPIFKDEMNCKQAHGTFKLLQKFNNAGVNEKLDDFRSSVMKGKWRFFPRP